MRRSLLAPLLWLALFLPAVAQAAPQPVTLWHAYRGDERAGLEAAIQAFHESQDAVRIEPLAVPYEAFRQRLTAAIPRGNGPDLFIGPHEATGEWSRAGLIKPYPGQLQGLYPDSAIDALRFDGQVWGVPLATKSLALFRNKALAATAPDTLEELLQAKAEFPLVYEAGNFYHHGALLHAYGARALDDDGKALPDAAETAASLDAAAALVSSGAVPPETDGALVSNLFNQDKAAFAINGPWFLGEIRDGLDFEVSPLPTVSATGRRLQPFLTVEALFLAERSEKPPEAVEAAVQAIAGLQGAVTRALTGGQVVALREAWQDPRVARDPVLAAFAAQAELAVAMPNRPEMAAVWEPANRALRKVLRGAQASDAAVARAQREVQFTLRPTPTPAARGPYLVLLGLLLLAVAAWSVRQARRHRVVPRARENWTAYLYLAPAVLGMVLVVFIPFIVGSAVSLFAHVDGTFTFVGLRNFGRILTASDYGVTDPLSFWFTLAVTVAWTTANVVAHVGIGLGLALLLRDPWMKLKGFYRVLLIVPWAVPNYITALIWKGMFNRQFGAINGVLAWFGIEPVSWFSSFTTSFAANVATNTWLGFPFMMVVTLGALQAIPRDLEEAAEVDGAGAWIRFRHITLPLLKPALLPAVILGSVWTFNMFNIIYLVSGGEPDGSTEILISEAYKWAFTRQAQYGYAAAYATLIFGILLLYTAITRRISGEEATA